MIPEELYRKIRRLEIRTRGLVQDMFAGEYHSAFRGRGIEFAEVRPYQFGDDVRTIDWNVTARLGEAYVKVFEEEREQTLILAVDASASESFGSGDVLKREMAAELCAVLALSAVRNNDRVGLCLFTDRVERFVPPRKGRRHALRILRDVFAHQVEHAGTDIGAALDHLQRVMRRRAIIVVLSDFIDDGYESRLRAISARHDVVAVQLVDPRELVLPDVGILILRDAETGRPVVVDSSSRRARQAFEAAARLHLDRTSETFSSAGIDSVTVMTDQDYVEPLAAFFRRRARRSRRGRTMVAS